MQLKFYPKFFQNVILSVFATLILTFNLLLVSVQAKSNELDFSSIKISTQTFKKTLSNGVKIIVKVDNRAPTVAHTVWYKVGSVDEPEGITGISHMLEHMMFKGTEKILSGQFSKIVAAIGGQDNAFTSRDNTTYFQLIPKQALSQVMDLEADRMVNLKLSDEEFVKEREVVREERRLRTDDQPQSLFWERINAYSYLNHPYRHPIIGWMSDIKSYQLQDLQAWYQKFYTPENATVIVVGDVNPDEVFMLAEKTYGQVKSQNSEKSNSMVVYSNHNEKIIADTKQLGKVFIKFKAPAHLPMITYIYNSPSLKNVNDDWRIYALNLLSLVLDGHSAARLTNELINKTGMAVSIGAGYSMFARGPSIFVISGSPSEKYTSTDLKNAIDKQIEQIINKGIDEEELIRAKRQLSAQSIYKLDSLFGQAREIGTMEILGLGYENINKILENINKISIAQVQSVAKEFLQDDNLTYGELIPTAEKEIK